MTKPTEDGQPELDEIRAQLARILASQGFANSNQRTDLLRYFVNQTIEGKSPKEAVVCEDVFPAYPPPPESRIVSVVATDVRKKLREYYGKHLDDPVDIQVPKAGHRTAYRASFSYRLKPEALKNYKVGLHLGNQCSTVACKNAITYLEKATEAQPSFVLAHAALANAQLNLAVAYGACEDRRQSWLFAQLPSLDDESVTSVALDRARGACQRL